MNCEEYKEFYKMYSSQMPGILPPHRHPVCEDQTLQNLARFEQQIDPGTLKEPSILDLALNFSNALTKWVKAGVPIVSEETYKKRASICDSCQFWDPKARMGLGKCNAPGCGCTKLKRWLATESCPIGKWGHQDDKTGPA